VKHFNCTVSIEEANHVFGASHPYTSDLPNDLQKKP
jgi:hypothetical protein